MRRIFGEAGERQKILDIACANGALLKPLRRQHELHGVDASESLIQKARENGFDAKVHDLFSGPLPYENGTFDYVLCGETIEHHPDTDWVLFECNRILKFDGRLVVTYPNIRTPVGIALLLLFDMSPLHSACYRSVCFRDFTLRTMKLALTKHGFRHINSQGNAFYLPKLGEFGSRLASRLPSWADQIITVAEKVQHSRYTPDDLRTDRLIFGG